VAPDRSGQLVDQLAQLIPALAALVSQLAQPAAQPVARESSEAGVGDESSGEGEVLEEVEAPTEDGGVEDGEVLERVETLDVGEGESGEIADEGIWHGDGTGGEWLPAEARADDDEAVEPDEGDGE
jgi:hypothetical protein